MTNVARAIELLFSGTDSVRNWLATVVALIHSRIQVHTSGIEKTWAQKVYPIWRPVVEVDSIRNWKCMSMALLTHQLRRHFRSSPALNQVSRGDGVRCAVRETRCWPPKTESEWPLKKTYFQHSDFIPLSKFHVQSTSQKNKHIQNAGLCILFRRLTS